MNTLRELITKPWLQVYPILVFDFLTIYLIIAGAMLIAVQMRTELSFGQTLGVDYHSHSLTMYLMMVVATFLAALFSKGLRSLLGLNTSKLIRSLSLLLALGLSALLIIFFDHDISRLQIIYYALTGIAIGLVTIWWPPYLMAYGVHVTLFFHLKQLWKYRILALIWVRYNIYSRYSQTMLGILWIMVLPLSTSLIIAFVFSQFIRSYNIGDVPFLSFFLVALTFWTVFSQGVTQGMNSLITKMGLITQVYFPREIILISKIGETFVDLIFIFSSMVIINALLGISPNINYLYLPLVIAIQFLFTLGISFFLSYLSVIIRDIPNLVGVGLQLLFYMTPILYPATVIPPRFRIIALLNPISPLIEAYRDIILYDKAPNFIDLYTPAVTSCIILYVGYKFFKSKESILADFI